MTVDLRTSSSQHKRDEQLRRWLESETNRTDLTRNNKRVKVNFSEECVFLAACAANDKQELLALLEKGADINTANEDGLTALHQACIDDNFELVEFLVNQGADVNQADMEGWTPLHATASCGHTSIAKFLLDRNADLSIVNNDGELPMDIVEEDDMKDFLIRETESRGIDGNASRRLEEILIEEDAQRWLNEGSLADNPHPKTGASALHVAAAKGYKKAMRLLLEAGADINSRDLDGWTPLHAAAHWGQKDSILYLCENMADMDQVNCVGQTAFDVADKSVLSLMDELKREQSRNIYANKPITRKPKTQPHRYPSTKREREDTRESDGTSEDEHSSDVAEKKHKSIKEKPQTILSVSNEENVRTVPQAKGATNFDESEIQSWRRPSLRKPLEDRNQEISRPISTPPRLNNRESDDLAEKRISLPEKDDRNHVDSMARISQPLVSTNSVLTTSTSPPVRSIGRSFVPPSRDEESETKRKAHAKMVRSTRRSTQGVTLDDIKSAEQLMKNKQQATTSSPESKELSSAPPTSNSVPQGAATTTTSPKPASPTKAEEEERRPSYRLRVDDSDKTKFSLENVRSKDKPEEDSDTQTVTVQLRKKNQEDKGGDEERNSQTREGTQAAIQRRKKPKRRSTGRVQVNMDEIDPEKRAQRLAEQQQQQQHQDDDNDVDDGEEEDDSSVSERGDVPKSTASSTHGSTSTVNSRPSSRGSSMGPENGDIDYKKLYEEQLEENFKVHERLRGTESELRMAREALEVNNKKNNTRLVIAEADKREKRALERKLSEMEEELKSVEELRQDNQRLTDENAELRQDIQRLKDENGALIRVISKLSK